MKHFQEFYKSAETTNWLAPQEQQIWFERFSSKDGADRSDINCEENNLHATGLKFKQFQEFLECTLYCYFSKFSHKQTNNNNNRSSDKLQGDANFVPNGSDLKESLDDLHVQQHDDTTNDCRFSKQQEMHLFKKFDTKNDHLIDRDEFVHLCSRWLHRVFNPTCVLVVVDVQNDFIDGSLALINGPANQDGADVVPIVNDLIETCQQNEATIIYTQDWHPRDHVSFYDNLHLRKFKLKGETNLGVLDKSTLADRGKNEDECKSNSKPQSATPANNYLNERDSTDETTFKYKKFAYKAQLYDTVLFDEGRVEQKLWPTHCVINSWGAQLHPKLKIAPDCIKIRKGTLSHVDAYSAFWDNMRLNETGLRQELVTKGVTDVFFCGLALDYCVAASALDSTKAGFVTFVVENACRGINLDDMEKRKQELRDHGAFIVQSNILDGYLKRDFNLPRDLIKTIVYCKASSLFKLKF